MFAQLISGAPTQQAISGTRELGQQTAGQIPTEQLPAAAAALGFGPNEIAQLERTNLQRQKLQQQQSQFEEKLRAQEEAPQRKIVAEEANKIQKRAQEADRIITDLKSLKKLADSPDLRAGKSRQLLDQFGLANFWEQPVSNVADKLIGDLNLASVSTLTTPGRVSSSLLQEVSKTNPSLLMTPTGIKNTA